MDGGLYRNCLTYMSPTFELVTTFGQEGKNQRLDDPRNTM